MQMADLAAAKFYGRGQTEDFQPDENRGLSSEVRLLNVGKNAQMWNEIYTEYAEHFASIPKLRGN